MRQWARRLATATVTGIMVVGVSGTATQGRSGWGLPLGLGGGSLLMLTILADNAESRTERRDEIAKALANDASSESPADNPPRTASDLEMDVTLATRGRVTLAASEPEDRTRNHAVVSLTVPLTTRQGLELPVTINCRDGLDGYFTRAEVPIQPAGGLAKWRKFGLGDLSPGRREAEMQKTATGAVLVTPGYQRLPWGDADREWRLTVFGDPKTAASRTDGTEILTAAVRNVTPSELQTRDDFGRLCAALSGKPNDEEVNPATAISGSRAAARNAEQWLQRYGGLRLNPDYGTPERKHEDPVTALTRLLAAGHEPARNGGLPVAALAKLSAVERALPTTGYPTVDAWLRAPLHRPTQSLLAVAARQERALAEWLRPQLQRHLRMRAFSDQPAGTGGAAVRISLHLAHELLRTKQITQRGTGTAKSMLGRGWANLWDGLVGYPPQLHFDDRRVTLVTDTHGRIVDLIMDNGKGEPSSIRAMLRTAAAS